jgi:hypothetical protein
LIARACQAGSSNFSTQYSGWLSSLQPMVVNATNPTDVGSAAPTSSEPMSRATIVVERNMGIPPNDDELDRVEKLARHSGCQSVIARFAVPAETTP